MKNWFGSKVGGLNADIERHRKHEAELRTKIAELEALEKPTLEDVILHSTYKRLLNELLDSKAQLTNQLGRNK